MNYSDLLLKLSNLIQLSTKETSIHIHFNIINDNVIIQSFLLNINGEKKDFEKIESIWNNEFYQEFLYPFLLIVKEKCNLVASDVISSTRDDLFITRFITENNDLFTIEGLSHDDAYRLLESTRNNQKIQLFE